MLRIMDIARYRDGGTPAILFTSDKDSLELFGLPNIARKLQPDNRSVYEVWRDIRSRKYFYGDINGEKIELGESHELIRVVHELLIQERARLVAPIDFFCDGL